MVRFKFFLLLFLFWIAECQAQTPDLNKHVIIKSEKSSVKSILDLITANSSLSFSYNHGSIALNRGVVLRKGMRMTIQQLLDFVALTGGFTYKILDNQIVLRLSEENRREFTISGYLKDHSTAEELIGAVVKINNTSQGTISNAYGFYSITLPVGVYSLSYSYVGYKSVQIEYVLDDRKKQDVELIPEAEHLNEIIVLEKKEGKNVNSVSTGLDAVSANQIKSVPSLFGEPDVLKVIKTLPGVHLTTELSANFSVRGGNYDQNLILLDEAVVYSPSHMLGLFSTFNNDAIKGMNFYKGLMPAKYGGRLSSVMDVRMKDGSKRGFKGTGGIGFIASRLTLEAPFKNDKGSLMLSGRRSYLDLLTRAADNTLPFFFFYDINGKVNYKLNTNNKIYVSVYSGRDVFKESGKFDESDFEFDWGNITATLRWNHLYSAKLFSNFSFVTSKYDYKTVFSDLIERFFWNSSLQGYSSKFDFEYYPNPSNIISFGYQNTLHLFEPGEAKGIEEKEFTRPIQKSQALEQALYANSERKINEKLLLSYGLRLSSFHNIGEQTVRLYDENNKLIDSTYYGKGNFYKSRARLSPRLGLNYKLNEISSLKLSYNRTVQYMQLASNTMGGTPLDIWFPSSPSILPQRGSLYSLGYFRNLRLNNFEFSSEIYYRSFKDQLDFADGSILFFGDNIDKSLRFGTGRAYGLELMLKKPIGRLSGWVSYTLSKTTRKINGVNNGQRYLSNFDRPHSASLVLTFKKSKKISYTASWIFSSGLPFTPPLSGFQYKGEVVPLYAEKNTDRGPDYHRLDIGMDIVLNKRADNRFRSVLNISVYNFYNRINSSSIYFTNRAPSIEIDEFDPGSIALKQSFFPIIPTVTWNFNF